MYGTACPHKEFGANTCRKMQEGVIREFNGKKILIWTENKKVYSVPMRSYQIPFFSAGERVYFDSRTGYCFRKEQNFPIRYALS